MILLVDDDPLQAFVRKSALEKIFPNVRRVSGAEALCLIEQSQFVAQLSLVISGTHMPGLSEEEFITELCSRLPKMPVLMLTDKPDITNPYSTGLIHRAPLPISTHELLRLSQQIIDLHNIPNVS